MGERASPAQRLEGSAFSAGTGSSRGLSRQEQLTQNFYAKVAAIVVQGRSTSSGAPPNHRALSPTPTSRNYSYDYVYGPSTASQTPRRVNKWFNIELPEDEVLRDELRPWKQLSITQVPAPALIIDIFLDIADFSDKGLVLSVADRESGVRRKVTDTDVNQTGDSIFGQTSPSAFGPRGPHRVLLESWQLTLTPLASSPQTDSTPPDLPVAYKKSVVFFRSLFSHVRLLPAYRLVRRLRRETPPAVHVGYRLETQRTYGGSDLGMEYPFGAGDVEEYTFGKVETPFGVFSLHTTYRLNCDFVVESTSPSPILFPHPSSVPPHFQYSSNVPSRTPPSNVSQLRVSQRPALSPSVSHPSGLSLGYLADLAAPSPPAAFPLEHRRRATMTDDPHRTRPPHHDTFKTQTQPFTPLSRGSAPQALSFQSVRAASTGPDSPTSSLESPSSRRGGSIAPILSPRPRPPGLPARFSGRELAGRLAMAGSGSVSGSGSGSDLLAAATGSSTNEEAGSGPSLSRRAEYVDTPVPLPESDDVRSHGAISPLNVPARPPSAPVTTLPVSMLQPTEPGPTLQAHSHPTFGVPGRSTTAPPQAIRRESFAKPRPPSPGLTSTISSCGGGDPAEWNKGKERATEPYVGMTLNAAPGAVGLGVALEGADMRRGRISGSVGRGGVGKATKSKPPADESLSRQTNEREIEDKQELEVFLRMVETRRGKGLAGSSESGIGATGGDSGMAGTLARFQAVQSDITQFADALVSAAASDHSPSSVRRSLHSAHSLSPRMSPPTSLPRDISGPLMNRQLHQSATGSGSYGKSQGAGHHSHHRIGATSMSGGHDSSSLANSPNAFVRRSSASGELDFARNLQLTRSNSGGSSIRGKRSSRVDPAVPTSAAASRRSSVKEGMSAGVSEGGELVDEDYLQFELSLDEA
ncbi:autophagy protein 13 [Gonapodya sp. JEL0774]|nr:autophagy protein 13 [Gonapodya sp. JEL0774]